MVSPVDRHEYIAADPDILVGKPLIRGTRIGVEFLLELIDAGWTHEEICENFPGITPDALTAALENAG
jgi:uncharacterized protein (DUF433 family)